MVETELVGSGEDTGRNLCLEVLEVMFQEFYASIVLNQVPLCCLVINSKGD